MLMAEVVNVIQFSTVCLHFGFPWCCERQGNDDNKTTWRQSEKAVSWVAAASGCGGRGSWGGGAVDVALAECGTALLHRHPQSWAKDMHKTFFFHFSPLRLLFSLAFPPPPTSCLSLAEWVHKAPDAGVNFNVIRMRTVSFTPRTRQHARTSLAMRSGIPTWLDLQYCMS